MGVFIAVRNLSHVTDFVNALVRLGYEDKGDGGVIERRYFVKGTEAGRTHHLNFYEMNSSGWATHILFCEYLKSHNEVAEGHHSLHTHPRDCDGLQNSDSPDSVWSSRL